MWCESVSSDQILRLTSLFLLSLPCFSSALSSQLCVVACAWTTLPVMFHPRETLSWPTATAKLGVCFFFFSPLELFRVGADSSGRFLYPALFSICLSVVVICFNAWPTAGEVCGFRCSCYRCTSLLVQPFLVQQVKPILSLPTWLNSAREQPEEASA